MKKRVLTGLLSLALTASAFVGISAQDVDITAYSGNEYWLGRSQLFCLVGIAEPQTVKINGTPTSNYGYGAEGDKLYIYGREFEAEGTYNIEVSDGTNSDSVSIEIIDNTVEKEYAVDSADFSRGAGVNDKVGANHSAARLSDPNAQRQPVAARGLTTSSDTTDLWGKWIISDAGNYAIDYWGFGSRLFLPVNVTVCDKTGKHTFEGIASDENEVHKYITLQENDKPYVFDFSDNTGGGEYYLEVRPVTSAAAGERNIFGIDSFKMKSYTSEHDSSQPQLTSDVYMVGDTGISGVFADTDKAALKSNLDIPWDCDIEFTMADNAAAIGDTIKVYKLYDAQISKTYTVESIAYINSNSYTIGSDTISDIPYGESYGDFVSKLAHAQTVTLKVFDGANEKTDGTIKDGYRLEVYYNAAKVGEYTLDVIAASSEKTITSSVYHISDRSITVPYGDTISQMLANITVSEFASLSYPYENEPKREITGPFDITVTAQDGSTAVYGVIVDKSASQTSQLTSDTYTVTSDAVGDVGADTPISAFKAALSATNGGTIKVFYANMQEKTSGNVAFGDIVRVYPRYKTSQKEYSSYRIMTVPQYRPKAGKEPEVVWSCVSDEKNPADHLSFTYQSGFRDGSTFGEKRKGYASANADVAAGARFSYTALADGSYNVQYWLAANQEGKESEYILKVLKDNTELTSLTVRESNSQLVDLGVYALNAGETLSVTSDVGSTHTNNFVSAALFTEYTSYEASVSDITEELDGSYSFKLSFNFDVDASTIEDAVTIKSENANTMPYIMEVIDSQTVKLTTKYPLEKGVRYYIFAESTIKSVSGTEMSRGLSANLFPQRDELLFTAWTDMVSGKVDMLCEGGAGTVNVFILQRKNNDVLKVERYTYDISSNSELSQSIELMTGCTGISLYATDDNGKLITNTYYAQ